jgi:MFS family permease
VNLERKPEPFPPGLHNAFTFAVFNALSYQMVLGSPMVLYAKTLDASATVLGVIAGMMPLLVIFQIPAAKHLDRVGYKNFMFGGWGVRVMFIVGMALVPLSGWFLSPPTQLVLLLAVLFGFNLSRGISSCAWLPWINAIIPESRRGAYLTREAAFVSIGSVAGFCLAAFTVGPNPKAYQFSILFAFSALMGMVSLVFMRRMPDAVVTHQTRSSATPVPWREIASYPPFRKLLWMNVVWNAAYGGLNAFVVAYLRTDGGMHEAAVLLVTAAYYVGGLGSLFCIGPRVDHWGSKPVLGLSFILWLVIMGGWVLMAGGVTPPWMVMVVFLQMFMGFAYSLVNMSNTRLAMVTIPVMGKNHFFALFSVVGSLVQGLAPVFWGMMIDALARVRFHGLGVEWNRFSIFFLVIQLVFLTAIIICQRLAEPAAKSTEEMWRDLWKSPARFKIRWWQ